MSPGRAPLLLSHPDCDLHVAPGHPERPERLGAIDEALAADPDLRGLPRRRPEPATRERLEAVHDPRHLAAIFDAGATADARGPADSPHPDTPPRPPSIPPPLPSP